MNDSSLVRGTMTQSHVGRGTMTQSHVGRGNIQHPALFGRGLIVPLLERGTIEHETIWKRNN